MKRFLILRSVCFLVVGSILTTPGCRPPEHGHSHEGGGDHEHEEKTAQITIWTDRFEVFAEHKAVVMQKPTKFITHVTDMVTLEPRTAGPVKFVMRQGETVFEHSHPAPERPGLYIPEITFPDYGYWNITLLIPAADGVESTVDLGRITAHKDEHAAAHADFPEAADGISFLKEQQWKILTRSEPALKREIVERIRVPALVNAKPGNLAQVTPPMPGQLHPTSGRKLPVVGEYVTNGQILAVVRPAFSEATAELGRTESEVAEARLTLAQAQRDLERAQNLFDVKADTAQRLELARLAYETAEARLNTALATRSSYHDGTNWSEPLPALQLKSPISGIIIAQSAAAMGEHIAADKPIYTVLDASTAFIEAQVAEGDARRVGGEKRALVESSVSPGNIQPLMTTTDGRPLFWSPHVDAIHRTVKLVYESPNTNGQWRIGERLTLHVESAIAQQALAVPESAIVEEGGQPVCFVQVSGETFQKREVILGIRDGSHVQVLRGLNENERVVTKGAMAIRLASVSSVIPAHGHAH
jgi:cobalt-zinc-cadmium efflux system membrane fusion protein